LHSRSGYFNFDEASIVAETDKLDCVELIMIKLRNQIWSLNRSFLHSRHSSYEAPIVAETYKFDYVDDQILLFEMIWNDTLMSILLIK